MDARTHSYRAKVTRCPGCGEPMQPLVVAGETVDECPACGGVYVDWFDGELGSIVASVQRGPSIAPRPSSIPPGFARDTCPRCNVAMNAEVVGVAPLLRCAECFGTFVLRDAFDLLLASLQAAPITEEPQSTWQRFVRVLRELLAGRVSQ